MEPLTSRSLDERLVGGGVQELLDQRRGRRARSRPASRRRTAARSPAPDARPSSGLRSTIVPVERAEDVGDGLRGFHLAECLARRHLGARPPGRST